MMIFITFLSAIPCVFDTKLFFRITLNPKRSENGRESKAHEHEIVTKKMTMSM
jgi:hypothetical protein